MITLAEVEGGFKAFGMPRQLIEELLNAFTEAKRRFYRGDLRPSAVEGGRFSEAALRILQWATVGTYTPVGDKNFSTSRIIDMLGKLPSSGHAESLRIHIPRALRVFMTCATVATRHTSRTASTQTSRTPRLS